VRVGLRGLQGFGRVGVVGCGREAVDNNPVWSPDGTQIAFSSNRKGSQDLYLKPSSGVGTEELLLETPNFKVPEDWSKDGRFLLLAN
jgi:Tol biopolymer transport system component